MGSVIRKSWLPSKGRGFTEARAAVLAVVVGPGNGGRGELAAPVNPGAATSRSGASTSSRRASRNASSDASTSIGDGVSKAE